MIIKCIKEGFSLTNKNWQLVPLRIVAAIINIVGFFVLVGTPVFVAIAYLGMDVAHAEELLPYLFENPLEFVLRYLRLVFLIVIAFIFYLTFSSILFFYTLSGTLGALKKSAVNMQYRFNLSSFFEEAKKHFFPLFRLVSILVPGFIILLALFIISGGLGAALLQVLSGTGSLEIFFSSFLMLSVIVFSIIIFFAAIVFIVYSVVALVIEGRGAVDSIKKTFNFLKDKPKAFLFYIVLILGIIAANGVLFIIEMPLNMVHGTSPLINVVFYIITAVFQIYLSIVIWSSLLVFYVKSAKYPVYHTTYDI